MSTVPRMLENIETAPTSADAAYHALMETSARFRERNDPRAVFADVYAVITRRVADCIRRPEARPQFLEPAWISRLAGFFAERYFTALADDLEGNVHESAAWSRAFEAAAGRSTFPLQDALLGINAHINYDLAQGLYDNVRLTGSEKDLARMNRFRRDHNIVNEILSASIPEALELLVERYHCPLAKLVTRSAHARDQCSRSMLFILAGWRGAVWSDLLSLLGTTSLAEYQRITLRTNRESDRKARLFALPLRPWRLAAPPSLAELIGAPAFA